MGHRLSPVGDLRGDGANEQGAARARPICLICGGIHRIVWPIDWQGVRLVVNRYLRNLVVWAIILAFTALVVRSSAIWVYYEGGLRR